MRSAQIVERHIEANGRKVAVDLLKKPLLNRVSRFDAMRSVNSTARHSWSKCVPARPLRLMAYCCSEARYQEAIRHPDASIEVGVPRADMKIKEGGKLRRPTEGAATNVGQMAWKAAFQFATWLLAVFFLLMIFAFLNPNQWHRGANQAQSTAILFGILLAVVFAANLITRSIRWLWRRRS